MSRREHWARSCLKDTKTRERNPEGDGKGDTKETGGKWKCVVTHAG